MCLVFEEEIRFKNRRAGPEKGVKREQIVKIRANGLKMIKIDKFRRVGRPGLYDCCELEHKQTSISSNLNTLSLHCRMLISTLEPHKANGWNYLIAVGNIEDDELPVNC